MHDESTIFHALSDATRRAIIERLAQRPQPVARLAEPFAISAPAISTVTGRLGLPIWLPC